LVQHGVNVFFLLSLHVTQDFFLKTKEENWHDTSVKLAPIMNHSIEDVEKWFIKYFGRYLTVDYIPHRIHIIGTIIYAFAAPFQFNSWLRNHYISIHRLTGKLYFLAGFSNLFSGLWLAWNSKPELGIFWPTFLFGPIYGYFLIQAYMAIIERKIELHKAYVTYSYMISFAIPMQRIAYIILVNMNVSLISQKIEHINVLFGRSFWIAIISMLSYAAIMGHKKFSHVKTA